MSIPTTPRPAGGYGSCPQALTQGQCDRCRVLFRWEQPPRLKDARCPECGAALRRCVARYSSYWLSTIKPVAGLSATA